MVTFLRSYVLPMFPSTLGSKLLISKLAPETESPRICEGKEMTPFQKQREVNAIISPGVLIVMHVTIQEILTARMCICDLD